MALQPAVKPRSIGPQRRAYEKVELVPFSTEESQTGKPGLAIHLHGALASLLRLACGQSVHEIVEAAAQTKKAPRKAGRDAAISSASAKADSQHADTIGELVLVAGTGFEPVTFRL